jgi:hypothetical protein
MTGTKPVQCLQQRKRTCYSQDPADDRLRTLIEFAAPADTVVSTPMRPDFLVDCTKVLAGRSRYGVGIGQWMAAHEFITEDRGFAS